MGAVRPTRQRLGMVLGLVWGLFAEARPESAWTEAIHVREAGSTRRFVPPLARAPVLCGSGRWRHRGQVWEHRVSVRAGPLMARLPPPNLPLGKGEEVGMAIGAALKSSPWQGGGTENGSVSFRRKGLKRVLDDRAVQPSFRKTKTPTVA